MLACAIAVKIIGEKALMANDIGIYKPKKDMTGAVAQFKLGKDRDCMFLELAKQTAPMDSPKPYDWEKTKITVKLGHTDIGKLLALFNGKLAPPQGDKPDLELFHKNAKGNKIISLKKMPSGFYLRTSMKEADRQDAIALPLSPDEVELIKIGLSKAYELILGW